MNLQNYLTTNTQQSLADLINADDLNNQTVTQGAISQWLVKGVPAVRVLQLERLSNGKMRRFCLRPDLYPSETNPQVLSEVG